MFLKTWLQLTFYTLLLYQEWGSDGVGGGGSSGGCVVVKFSLVCLSLFKITVDHEYMCASRVENFCILGKSLKRYIEKIRVIKFYCIFFFFLPKTK